VEKPAKTAQPQPEQAALPPEQQPETKKYDIKAMLQKTPGLQKNGLGRPSGA
jgi:hypothetical protein